MAGKERIWELDALRGIMILLVVFIHLCFDLDYFLGIDLVKSPVLQTMMDHCGMSFVVLSGLCASIGPRSLRRGLRIFLWGMVITAVTAAMAALGLADRFIIIYFGVLHLIGSCMMLWPLLRRLPVWAWAALSALCIGLGQWFSGLSVGSMLLMPLGLPGTGFISSDYFPLLPGLGWFLAGACLGAVVYWRKQTLLPRFPSRSLPVRALRWCGTHSLWIYLFHQPVLYGAVFLVQQGLL